MNLTEQLSAQGVEWRRVETEDATELVVDFGFHEHSSVDMVDGTVIVIVGEDQYEFDVSPGARAFMNNGVLTIEVER